MRSALLGALIVLAGCAAPRLEPSQASASPAPAPTFASLTLIVTPTPISIAPLPTAEAAVAFVWPAVGRPSLIFIFDDAAT